MTLDEINAYMEASAEVDKREHLNMMGLTRVAFHASGDEYENIVRDLM